LFQLRPSFLEGIQVRRIGWKIEQFGHAFFNALPHSIHLVTTAVIPHHHSGSRPAPYTVDRLVRLVSADEQSLLLERHDGVP
jgi:hypothetical protein